MRCGVCVCASVSAWYVIGYALVSHTHGVIDHSTLSLGISISVAGMVIYST